MKRLTWALVLPFALFCSAHADSIYTFDAGQVTYIFGVNQGGDNASYSLIGPNINLTGGGTAFCQPPTSFCDADVPILPGTSLNPSIGVDFEFSTGGVKIGGHTYEAVLFVSSITAAPFTFPMGGNVPATFTVAVPAAFSVVAGMVQNQAGSPLNVTIPPGKLVLTFKYFPAANGDPARYFFSRGQYVVTTPEPGTLGLMATGLAGIVGMILRKRDWQSVRF
jgi:hypothetical protein